MFKLIRAIKPQVTNYRTFKNFGHKRQPVAAYTTLWHGFLTFTFIGLLLKWNPIFDYLLGDEPLFVEDKNADDQFMK